MLNTTRTARALSPALLLLILSGCATNPFGRSPLDTTQVAPQDRLRSIGVFKLEPVPESDEPTSAQDLGQQHNLLELAQTLCREQDYAVVAVLHDLNHALRYSRNATLLDNGKMIQSGTPQEVITPSNISHYWKYQPRVAIDPDGLKLIA